MTRAGEVVLEGRQCPDSGEVAEEAEEGAGVVVAGARAEAAGAGQASERLSGAY